MYQQPLARFSPPTARKKAALLQEAQIERREHEDDADGFQAWFAPENMDDEGRQRRPLGDLIVQARR
jgi:hypothetical protein